MKKCLKCRKNSVRNNEHDFCYKCFKEQEKEDLESTPEESFVMGLVERAVYTVYVMFYKKDGKNKNKIGYTNDLKARIIELSRLYPENELVYFREFAKESEARRYEIWLKGLFERELIKIIADFQEKINRVKIV